MTTKRALRVYYSPTSICSNMVAMAVACATPDELEHVDIIMQDVEIWRGEQYEEWFLKISWRGNVPVLTDSERAEPVPETLDITRYLKQFEPSLFPSEHTNFIESFLESLHALNFFSLTYGAPPKGEVQRDRVNAMKEGLDTLLANPDITDEYRAMLVRKRDWMRHQKLDGLELSYAQEQMKRAAAVLATVRKHYDQRPADPFIFGKQLSIVDAHLAPVFGRLRKVGKHALIDDAGLTAYADAVLATEQWQRVGKRN